MESLIDMSSPRKYPLRGISSETLMVSFFEPIESELIWLEFGVNDEVCCWFNGDICEIGEGADGSVVILLPSKGVATVPDEEEVAAELNKLALEFGLWCAVGGSPSELLEDMVLKVFIVLIVEVEDCVRDNLLPPEDLGSFIMSRFGFGDGSVVTSIGLIKVIIFS